VAMAAASRCLNMESPSIEMTHVMGSTAEAYDRSFTVGRSHGEGQKSGEGQARRQAEQADRPLLLADAERLEDIDHAGGVRTAVQCDPGKHRARRSVQASLPEHLAEQPDAGDCRPQWAR